MAKILPITPSISQELQPGQGLQGELAQIEAATPELPTELSALLEEANRAVATTSTFVEQPRASDRVAALAQALFATRAMEVQDPTPRYPNIEMDPLSRASAQLYESNRLQQDMADVQTLRNRAAFLEEFERQEPEMARRLLGRGGAEGKIQEIMDGAIKAGQGTWRALDFLLRNFDRPAGAIRETMVSRSAGASWETSYQRGLDVLLGSKQGWKWFPEEIGPSYKQLLLNAGFDDNFLTKGAGFVMDVFLDPLWAVSAGTARGATMLTSGQVLSKRGFEHYAHALRSNVDELARAKGLRPEDLPIKLHQEAIEKTMATMRNYINSSQEVAEQMLDLGGLKIAGLALPLTRRRIKGTPTPIRGKATAHRTDFQTQNVLKYVLGEAAHATSRGGQRLRELGLEGRLQRLMEHLPENLRDLGEFVGKMVNRTNPAAGHEYKVFKQSQLYSKLALASTRATESYQKFFRHLAGDDLERAAFAIEDEVLGSPGAINMLLSDLAQDKGAKYAEDMDVAIRHFTGMMDEIVIDEAKRGYFQRAQAKQARKKGKKAKAKVKWTEERFQAFKNWVDMGRPENIGDPKMLKEFRNIYIEGYVPHVYKNSKRADELRSRPSSPRGVSITDVHTFKRLPEIPDLRTAVDKNLVPELNLAKLYMIRRNSWERAKITHEFLEETAREWGVPLRNLTKNMPDLAELAGEEQAFHIWQLINNAPKGRRGKLDTRYVTIDDQMNYARIMAMEPGVPTKTLSFLEDEAIEEFLRYRFRVSLPSKARYIWDTYVEGATKSGHYNGFARAPGKDIHDAVAKAKGLDDPNYTAWRPMTIGGIADPELLSNVMLPKAIVDDLENIKRKLLPPEIGTMLHTYDLLQNNWKRLVTVPFPSFHFRNRITNVLNSALDIGTAVLTGRPTMWSIMRGADGYLVTDAGVKISYSAIRKAARDHGVHRAIYKRNDVRELAEEMAQLETSKRARFGRVTYRLKNYEKMRDAGELVGVGEFAVSPLSPTLTMTPIGSAIENSDRMLLFIQSVKRGMPFEQAASRVDRFLFDYDDLSHIERQLMRRLFVPFYTWTRKNMALQASEFFTRPWQLLHPYKLVRAFSEEKDARIKSDLERKLLPEWLGDVYGVRLSVSPDYSTWLMNFDVPQETINFFWKGGVRKTFLEWASQLNPVWKYVIEEGFKTDTFTGKPVRFSPDMRTYEIVASMPESWKRFLGVQQRQTRDETYYVVNNHMGWRGLMWLTTFAGQTRFLQAMDDTLFNEKKGNLNERLIALLTGFRVSRIRPDEELRFMMRDALNRDETGALRLMNHYKRQAMLALQLKNAERDQVLQQLQGLTAKTRGVVVGSDLDEEGWAEPSGIEAQ